jgi:hypothetical protein
MQTELFDTSLDFFRWLKLMLEKKVKKRENFARKTIRHLSKILWVFYIGGKDKHRTLCHSILYQSETKVSFYPH